MKQLVLSDIGQVYSQRSGRRPVSVWALLQQNTEGFSQELLDHIDALTENWVGWGFGTLTVPGVPMLLFEFRDDAILINLTIGELHEDN